MKTLVSKFFSVFLAASILISPVLGAASELPHTAHEGETHDVQASALAAKPLLQIIYG